MFLGKLVGKRRVVQTFPLPGVLWDRLCSRLVGLFLRCHQRRKNGKNHAYWSVVENQRSSSGKVIQRQVLYLGELDQAQRSAWEKLSEQMEPSPPTTDLLPGFSSPSASTTLQPPRIDFSRFSLHNPRQWGACWIADRMWRDLQMEEFWRPKLPPSREGTAWRQVLQTLVTYRLIDPGSEFRLHRQWLPDSAMADLLGCEDSLRSKDSLYRCLDKLLVHREDLFLHLKSRWKDLFGASFDLLLYDLTSTYFESDPPFPEGDKRRHGYSRDHRPDCVQVVIALVLTPDGFPLAYEVMPGNSQDKATLVGFLKKMRRLYGKARRTWIMDRGLPTEETLALMRKPRHRISYLVGTPKGKLSGLEARLAERPWKEARPSVAVKLLPNEGEVFVYVESESRISKERSMRRRKLRQLVTRLKELRNQKGLSRDELLLKLGQAKEKAGRAYGLVEIQLPETQGGELKFHLNKTKLRQVRRREGRYLLRSNLAATDPAELWELYLRLVEIEAAFRNLKSDLSLRPIYHSKENRVEAHIFVAFVSYCLHVCLRGQLRRVAGGLTPRALLSKFESMELVDVHLPMSDGRTMVMARRTQPNMDQRLLLDRLGWELPEQGPPRIAAERSIGS